jgi:putative chitinase
MPGSLLVFCLQVMTEPELVATPKYALMTAGWFWSTHGCNPLAENADWVGLTKKINGVTIGLQDRIKHTQEAIAVLS